MSGKEFFEFCRKKNVRMMDLKFVDMLGSWQHCSYPVETLDESIFSEGLGFDGSSIRGWQEIHQSDMMAVCDPQTAQIDPFFAEPTVSVIANIVDPESREDYGKCPRHVVRRAAEFLKESKIATPVSSARSRSSSSSTRCASSRTSIRDITRSTRWRARGTRPASRSSTPWRCARTRTSSRCTTTLEPKIRSSRKGKYLYVSCVSDVMALMRRKELSPGR